VTSFDLNFREKLWNVSGGADRAVEVIARIVEHVDVLVGNEEDLQKGLGIEGPKVEDKTKSKLDPSAFFGMIDRVVKKHPQVKVVATTLREVHSTKPAQLERGGLGGWEDLHGANRGFGCLRSRGRRRWIRGGILLRIADGRRSGRSGEAWMGAWALLTTFPGDTTMATLDQVRAFAKGGSARIQR